LSMSFFMIIGRYAYIYTYVCSINICVDGTGDHCVYTYQWVYYHIIIGNGQATTSTFCRFYKKTIPRGRVLSNKLWGSWQRTTDRQKKNQSTEHWKIKQKPATKSAFDRKFCCCLLAVRKWVQSESPQAS